MPMERHRYPKDWTENCERSNLVALCAPCHLRADKEHHAQTRKRRREEYRRHMAEHANAADRAS